MFHLSCSGAAASTVCHAVPWHFFIKLDFAAPASGLPFLSIAFGSQASFAHFVMKLFNAAPTSGLPSFPMALLLQLSWAKAGVATAPRAKAVNSAANSIVLMTCSCSKRLFGSHGRQRERR